MEVLLREDVANLGKRGEVVKVADGHARNFLLPRKMAVIPSEHALKAIEAEKCRAEKAAQQEAEKYRELAASLEGTSCTITAKAGEGGHLFGSVSAAQIAQAFQEEGHKVDEHMVSLEEPIKELGVYTVQLKIHPGVESVTRVWVVGE